MNAIFHKLALKIFTFSYFLWCVLPEYIVNKTQINSYFNATLHQKPTCKFSLYFLGFKKLHCGFGHFFWFWFTPSKMIMSPKRGSKKSQQRILRSFSKLILGPKKFQKLLWTQNP